MILSQRHKCSDEEVYDYPQSGLNRQNHWDYHNYLDTVTNLSRASLLRLRRKHLRELQKSQLYASRCPRDYPLPFLIEPAPSAVQLDNLLYEHHEYVSGYLAEGEIP